MNNRQQNIAALLFYAITMLVVALVSGCNQKEIEVVVTPDMIMTMPMHADSLVWANDPLLTGYDEPVHPNYPESMDEWAESASSIGVHPDSMTVDQYWQHRMREQ